MDNFFGNLATFLGGVLGGGVGFIVIAIVVLALMIPLVLWTRDSRAPVKHSGLERFAASLDKPDEGYNDVLPNEPENQETREPYIEEKNERSRSTGPRPIGT